MTEENEKIWLEPKVAIQIVNKILSALDGNKGDGKGITLNVPVDHWEVGGLYGREWDSGIRRSFKCGS